MKTELTVKEALGEGFTHAVWNEQDFNNCNKIDTLKEADFDDANTYHNGFVVCAKETTSYGLSNDLVECLISDHIDCQDEFNDENGELSAIALEGCDELLKSLTDKMNENLSKRKFYFKTDIKLIP